ncbi:MAG: hypothetical protein PHP50_02545 [Lachnospiraceae bacterium]|nr:hypothetical protein [Lachnospiraceae bacterium]
MPGQVQQPVQQELDPKAEKKRIREEKKQLKKDQKLQRKEAKRKAKEISEAEDRLEEEGVVSGGVPVFLVTALIVAVWIAILCLLIKLDVGGFGSNILRPVLKDVPIINQILPGESTMTGTEETDMYGGYTNLKDAVEQIKALELQLEQAQSDSASLADTITQLQAEVDRLKTFEDQQVEFERIKNEFYEEVVYSDKGPEIEEYQKYYETIDPTNAEYLYKQVVEQEQADQAIEDYASAYSAMKPKEAAGIFEAMTDNLDLAAKILEAMGADDRGAVMGAMDPAVAARLTKIMDPGY